MKTIRAIKKRYALLVAMTFMAFSSCEVARDLDSYDPLFLVDAENAITDEVSADLALLGAYAGFLRSNEAHHIFTIPSMLSGVFDNNAFEPEFQGFADNTPFVDSNRLLLTYAGLYAIVGRANWVLDQVPSIDDSQFETPTRKAEILAEARGLRALANFYLLRFWGQFYDTNSQYGIVLVTDPVRNAFPTPRNTVAETYDYIIADLDEAIANAPDQRGGVKYFVSKTFAKGLKAKVLLYRGDYAEAAALAQDVIENSPAAYDLGAAYGDAFYDHSSPAIFESPEVLFGTQGTIDQNTGLATLIPADYGPSFEFTNFGNGTVTIGGQVITYDSDRISGSLLDDGFDIFSLKYREGFGEEYDMTYHLRMAEMYLIHAEAAARAANAVTTDALDALNAVRIRAGATTTGGDGFETYPASISYDEFIEAVRIEKYIELHMETGEEWFDLVRYHFLDGFDLTTVKATAGNSSTYIMPMPANSIEASGGVVVQNPNY